MTNKEAKPVRHIPQRTCIACHEVLSKRSMLRLVRTADGVQLDPGGKMAGRGAYLHNSRDCWEKALNKGLLARSLKTELTEADKDHLKQWMDELTGE